MLVSRATAYHLAEGGLHQPHASRDHSREEPATHSASAMSWRRSCACPSELLEALALLLGRDQRPPRVPR
jgi:hypothetical protein